MECNSILHDMRDAIGLGHQVSRLGERISTSASQGTVTHDNSKRILEQVWSERMSAIEQVIVWIKVRTKELVSTLNQGVAQDWVQRVSIRQMSVLQKEHVDDSARR